MAKTKVEQYIFQAGIPIKDNRYHMAHELITNNVEFICDEVTAWIAEQVKTEPKYPDAYTSIVANKEFLKDEVMSWFDVAYPGVHDLTYSASAATYDPATGILVLTIGSHGFQVGSTLRIATDSLTFTCALDSHATNHSYPRATGSNAPGGWDYAYNVPVSVTAFTGSTVTVNIGISSDTSAHTFVSATADGIISNERHEKCERDTGYNIDAITTDLYNGGNSKSVETARKYWEGTNTNLGSSNEQTYATLVNNKLLEIINGYILTNTGWTTAQVPPVTTQDVSNPIGESNAKNRVTELHGILNDVTINGLDNLPAVTPSWSHYTYDGELCERDTRLNLQGVDGDGGILYDLRYGGNEQTRYTASKYWINATPQIDGNRSPELFAKNYVRDLINNYILLQPVTAQTYPYAIALLEANKQYIADEATAWFDLNFPGVHTGTRHTKCIRDTKYNIEALTSDIYTGSNFKIIDMVHRYWSGTSSQLPGGETILTTAVSHGRSVDDVIEIRGMVLSCPMGTKTYPVADFTQGHSSNQSFAVRSQNLTATTFEIFLGTSSVAQTYIRGGVAIPQAGTQLNNRLDIRNFDYDTVSGVVTITTMGGATVTAAAHGRSKGDLIAVNGAVLSCSMGSKTYPVNSFSTAHSTNQTFTVSANNVTTDTFEVFFGISAIATTYVSGGTIVKAGNIRLPIADFNYTPGATHSVSAAIYDPTSGVLELTIGTHDFEVGNNINITTNSLTFTCALDSHSTNHTYPRATGSNAPGGADYAYETPVEITAKTSTTVSVNVGVSSNTSAHTFVSATANNITSIPAANSVSDAVYTPATGIMQLTIGAHSYKTGDTIKIATNSLTFTCALDSHATNHTYPRATGSAAPGGADYAYNTNQTITSVDATSITVNVGISSNTSAHTFVSATTHCITNSIGSAGKCVITVANHGLSANDTIDIRGVVMDCVYGTKVYPAIPHAGIYPVTKVTDADTLDFYLPPSEIDHTYVSGGTVKPATLSNVGSSTVITAFAYNNDTALITITSTSHGLAVGDLVKLADITLSCNTGTKVYPDSKVSSGVFYVYDVPNTNTIIIGMDRSNVAHTYVSGGTCQKVTYATSTSVNISNFVFDTHSGHGLSANDNVLLRGIVTDCAYGTKIYPALVHAGLYPITKTDTADTLEFFLPPSNIAHTYVSGGTVNDVTVTDVGSAANITGFVYDKEIATFTITTTGISTPYSVAGATYTPTTGVMDLVIGVHTLEVGDKINITATSLTFTCAFDNNATQHSYPRATGSNAPGGADYAYNEPVEILSKTASTITINVGTGNIKSYTPTAATYIPTTGVLELTIGAHTLVTGNYVDIDATSLNFTCTFDNNVTTSSYPRATGSNAPGGADYFYNTPCQVTATSATTITLNVGAGNVKTYTPTGATYNPTTGVMELTIGSHSLVAGKYVDIATNSLSFTCALDSNATTKTYPRPSGSAAPGGYDYAYNTPVEITGVTATSITINVGVSSNTSAHTFVSATSGCISNSNAHTFTSATADCISHAEAHTFVSATADCVAKAGHGLEVGDKVRVAGIQMSCQYGNKTYPENNSGIFIVYDVPSINTFILGSDKSEIDHTWIGGGTWQKITYTTSNPTNISNFAFGPSERTYAVAVNQKTEEIINDYIFTNTAWTSLQFGTTQTITSNNAEVGASSRITSLMDSINNVTVNGLDYLPTPGYAAAGYTPLQTTTSQYFNTSSVAESAASAVITDRFGIITDVIENGLDNVPELDRAKISAIKLQTRVPTNDLLLITDTTVNEVLFNFTDSERGASVKFITDEERLTKGVEDDFPKFLERTGTITTIYLDVNTDTPTYSPNARVQLEANKEFLQKEATAWIGNKISTATTYPYAKALIDANKEWLADEVMAWFDITYPNAHSTIQHEKCERDTKFNIDAIAYDIYNGSNTKTRDTAKKYWEGTNSLLANSGGAFTETTTSEISYAIAVNNKLRDLIVDNILTNTVYTTQQNPIVTVQSTTSNNGETKTLSRVTDLIGTFTSVIQNGISALPNSIPAWSDYTYNGPKCERDVGYQIDALIHDIKYGGNAETYRNAEKYWIQATPQIDGDRSHETFTKDHVRYLINDYIFKNVTYPTLQVGGGAVAQNVIYTAAELGVDTRVSELFAIINNVITNGTGSLPVKDEPKVFADTDDIQIFIDQGDLKVRPYDFGTDAIERMRVATAQSMLDADFEYGLQPTKWQAIATQRGYPSIYEVPGTDKQVQQVQTDASTGTGGIGQSLITVTTIGAHGIEIGSPITLKALENSVAGASRAEGSFIVSTTPTTNTFTYFAKSKVGTANGQILSTFYTQLRQAGFYTGAAIGDPSFAILSQGSSGVLYNPLAALDGADKITWSGDEPEIGAPVLVETGVATAFYTYSAADALRTAGTYNNIVGTTSSIVADLIVPTVNIVVDGVGSALATVVTGGRRNAVDDTITITDAQLGGGGAANLTFKVQTTVDGGTKIPTGSQVTSLLGTGGTIQTIATTSDVNIGSNSIPVVNTAGILPGHGIDRGDGTAVFVSSVVGNTVNLDGNTTNTIVGNVVTYSDVAGTNHSSAGFGATFDISRTSGNYTVTINTDGDDYETGDVVVVLGNLLGGATPENDCTITVTEADTSGDIVTITSSGTAFDGSASYAGITGSNSNGVGTGSLFDISYTNNTYSVSLAQPTFTNISGINLGGDGFGASFDITLLNNAYSVAVNIANDASVDYIVGDRIKIDGLSLGGVTSVNDAEVKVTSVNVGTGEITGISVTGVAADAEVSYPNVTYTTGSIGGLTANIQVERIGTVYSVTITGGGSGYSATDTLNIVGTELGGTSPANDASITIQTVDGSGGILTATIGGVAINTETFENLASGLNQLGSAGTFDVTCNYNNTYTVVIGTTGGTNYGVDQQIKIEGTALLGNGTSPANDVVITVTSIGALGLITGITHTGTSADATTNYILGDRLEVLGSVLGGIDTTNDAGINVTGVTAGKITAITIDGTAPDASETYVNPVYTTNTASGQNASFTVTRLDVAYSAIVTVPGTGYLVGETFDIDGANLGGSTTTNDCQITVATVGGSGDILTITVTGTALDQKTYYGISQALNQAQMKIGAGATWNVILSGGTFTTTLANPGTDYNATQEIKILGTQVGGGSPTNDLTITINSVNATGGITTFSDSGTAPGGTASYTDIGGTNLPNNGTDATFDIIRSTGTYSSIVINNDGVNYIDGNKIKILGSALGGVDSVNDLIITITGATTDGSITTVTGLGTAISGTTVQTYSSLTISESTTAAIPTNSTIAFAALATVEVTFETAHGLVPGDSFIITIDSDSGANNHTLCEGPFFAQSVPTNVKLNYQCRAPGAITDVDDIVGNIYPRPDSFFVHRPYDGGVMLGTGGPQHGAQAIRQSKKYIRYQSGKGIMYTTGALFAPSYDLLDVTADGLNIGSFITVTTDDVDHGLQIGGRIRLIGIETPGYNGDYTVASIVSERMFKVVADFKLGSLTPTLSARAQVSLLTWHGATVRSGAFDDQNGIFMEYDGENFTCVQRTATLQLAGVVSIAVDSNECSGVGTRFRDQIKAGDRVVIKGMTHVINQITSNTSMTVTPDFRGVTPASACKICLVSDKKTKQNEFNKDRLDGTGSSGYIIDVSKMQMMGIQYSWYGAGFIDYMLRGDDGQFVFFHRMRNSNINTEAFMRTGNMPVRYEITNEGPSGKLAADVDDNQTTIPLTDAKYFPSSGVIYLDSEMISYTGITGDTLTGCTRAAPMSNYASGANRTYTAGVAASHTAKTGVPLISNTISPIISHWGSAFLTDGGFDSDRGYIFSYASTGNEITTTRNTVFMLRLAPSVSNAIVGDLGERELLNRAQLLLEGIEVTSDTSTGGIVIEGVLNPQNYPLDPGNVGWSGLSGLAAGGQPSFAQVAPGGGVTWSTGPTQVIRNGTTTSQLTASADALYANYWGRNYLYFSEAQWEAMNGEVVVGTEVIATGSPGSGTSDFPSGTTITQIYDQGSRYFVRFTNGASGQITAGESVTFGVGGDLTYTNYLYFTKASWETTQAVAGTEVSDAKFPGGTAVSHVAPLAQFGGTEFYKVTFSQTSIATVTAGATVGFLFGQPPYAQPGETVFSFIANPGELANLDLSGLKELTNTTLGGRGTYPNGPDVLAINVYKTSGAAVDANLILRWGEAQA